MKVGNFYKTSTAIKMLELDPFLRFARTIGDKPLQTRVVLFAVQNPNGSWIEVRNEASCQQMGLWLNLSWELLQERTSRSN
jgi:hypothetical protein